MGETMQVIQVEVFLKEKNPALQDRVENALRSEIPGCIPCNKYDGKAVKFFGLIDNMHDPIAPYEIEKVIGRFKKDISIWGVHIWEMDVDEPTYSRSGP